MARLVCDICHKNYSSKDSLRVHKTRYHKETTEPLDLHIIPKQEDPGEPIVKTEDEDYLVKQYLKERDNRYNHNDFLKYEAKMKLAKHITR